ncbi:MAG: nucleotidyltransferase family protein [Acidimicrobiia bacterium]
MNDVAAAVAAYGVPSRCTLPTEPLAAEAFASTLDACVAGRVVGLLGSAVGAGAFPVTDEQREELEEVLRSWALHGVKVEQVLVRAVDALTNAGVPVRVLKGPAMGRTVYPEPEQRVFGDVDLLVPTGRVLDAVRALEGAFEVDRVFPELRPGFDDRFGREVTLRGSLGVELDLHRTFVDGPFGLMAVTDDFFVPPYRFPLAGYEFATLPMPQRLLAAAYTAALGDWPPRLVSLRDVVQLVLREQPNLLDVLMTARSWQCEVVLARAVTAAWDTLQVTEDAPVVTWARNFEPDRRARMLLKSGEGPARAFTCQLAALAVLPGRDRLAYARAIFFPQRSTSRPAGCRPARTCAEPSIDCGTADMAPVTTARRALRYAFAIACPDDSVAAELDPLFAGLPLAEAGDDVAEWRVEHSPAEEEKRWRFLVGDDERGAAERLDALRVQVVQSLNREAVRSWAGPVCHAGCVARDGTAIVLPADPESGKSTLTSGLVRAGFSYVTDEGVAFVPGTTRIEPYPKPISLDPGSWFLFPELAPTDDGEATRTQWQVPPDAFRPGAASGPCDARFLVFPKYVEGATTELRVLPRAEALVELAKNTFEFNQHSVVYLHDLEVVVRACASYRLTVGTLDDAVACVEELVADV